MLSREIVAAVAHALLSILREAFSFFSVEAGRGCTNKKRARHLLPPPTGQTGSEGQNEAHNCSSGVTYMYTY